MPGSVPWLCTKASTRESALEVGGSEVCPRLVPLVLFPPVLCATLGWGLHSISETQPSSPSLHVHSGPLQSVLVHSPGISIWTRLFLASFHLQGRQSLRHPPQGRV